jgi:ABC-type polysaccharide/polyol phosphate export permease
MVGPRSHPWAKAHATFYNYQGGAVVVAYFGEVWRIRHFWMALVRSDLRSRYRRSLLGLGWSLLQPIAMTVVLCTVYAQLFHQSLTEFAPNVLCGFTFWNFISAVTNQGCQSFFQGEADIRQHHAPLAIYPLRTVLGANYHFAMGMLVCVVLTWALKGFGNLPALSSLIPGMLLLFVFGWALAVCTGILNVLFQDAQHLLEIVLQITFYLTPILYPGKIWSERGLGWVLYANPFTSMLELVRQPLVDGQWPEPFMIGISALSACIAMLLAALLLRNWEKNLIFHL